MPETSHVAQYVMSGMIVILVFLMVTIFFHMKGTPPKDVPDEEGKIEGDESIEDYHARLTKFREPINGVTATEGNSTLEDHALRIAARAKEDPGYTPYN